ncbi:hypothetical protein DPMN_138741 [Dreissena polymorpha]|uniref:Uncharacterized protein n=1 Tax=Dreissena polymorpha TaxID=45954 RepID=A0A9D4JFW7_DREPO|nr:hypothetical protein DPMN_138741 [Dreissena polymorpha]
MLTVSEFRSKATKRQAFTFDFQNFLEGGPPNPRLQEGDNQSPTYRHATSLLHNNR